MNTPDYKTTCFGHIASLKYAMAGDMESVDLLRELERRLRVIEWENPAFIQLSEEMRAPVPKLTPDQEKELQPSLVELVYVQMERIASDSEAAAAQIPMMKTLLALQNDAGEQQKRLINLLAKFGELYVQMNDRLQLLGVDTAEYEIPDELWP
jgi:hypothetical protein